VSRYQAQPDYSEEIDETFARFRQGEVKDYRVTYRTSVHLAQVGSKILEFLSRLYPEQFTALEHFCQTHGHFVSDQMIHVDFELGFYLAYLDYIEPIRASGLAFCYPDVTDGRSGIVAEETYDIVLARKPAAENKTVVPNTFRLTGDERIFVVSGANQGGKSTFVRTLGQLRAPIEWLGQSSKLTQAPKTSKSCP
jgi:DNA mismatch repair protein MutS